VKGKKLAIPPLNVVSFTTMNSSNSMPNSMTETLAEDDLTPLLISLLKLCSLIGDPMKVGVPLMPPPAR
jgi:hypothetical protein